MNTCTIKHPASGDIAVVDPDDLTPYDTGMRAEPKPWVSARSDFTAIHGDRDPEDFGNVDFDDEHGETIATVHVSRNEDGTYAVHVAPHRDGVTIENHEED